MKKEVWYRKYTLIHLSSNMISLVLSVAELHIIALVLCVYELVIISFNYCMLNISAGFKFNSSMWIEHFVKLITSQKFSLRSGLLSNGRTMNMFLLKQTALVYMYGESMIESNSIYPYLKWAQSQLMIVMIYSVVLLTVVIINGYHSLVKVGRDFNSVLICFELKCERLVIF